jgi:hypothetical protein
VLVIDFRLSNGRELVLRSAPGDSLEDVSAYLEREWPDVVAIAVRLA